MEIGPLYVHTGGLIFVCSKSILMPVSGKMRSVFTLGSIYKRISDLDIYRYYIGSKFQLRSSFPSPLRKDRNPSFSIIQKDDGKYHHFDYAHPEFAGDAIDFVCQLFGLTITQAMEKIDEDFGLGIKPNSAKTNEYKRIVQQYLDDPLEVKRPKHIVVSTRKMNTQEAGYWNQYHLSTDDCRKGNVYAVDKVWMDGRRVAIRATDLVFAMKFGRYWKIYFPLRPKGERWLINNVPFQEMGNMENFRPDWTRLLVTKAKKDELFLIKFIMPEVLSVQGENYMAISETNLELFKPIPLKWINFDSDYTGIEASKYFNPLGYGWINCPSGYKTPQQVGIKDLADLGRYHTPELVQALFKRKGIWTYVNPI